MKDGFGFWIMDFGLKDNNDRKAGIRERSER